jgi:hypothetical protein
LQRLGRLMDIELFSHDNVVFEGTHAQ